MKSHSSALLSPICSPILLPAESMEGLAVLYNVEAMRLLIVSRGSGTGSLVNAIDAVDEQAPTGMQPCTPSQQQ